MSMAFGGTLISPKSLGEEERRGGQPKEERRDPLPIDAAPGEPRSGEKARESKGGGGDPSRKANVWSELSEDDRNRLREALRQVWSDPAVINAREEVKEASDAYQKAMSGAVQRVDPTVAETLFKVQKSVEREMRERLGGPSGFPGAFPRPGEEYPTHPPGFLERLTPEQRERWKAIEDRTRETPEVQAALRSLEEIRKQDEELRRRRLEAHRQVRAAMMAELSDADSEFAEMMERWQNQPNKSTPGEPRGPEGKSSRERQGGGLPPVVPPQPEAVSPQ